MPGAGRVIERFYRIPQRRAVEVVENWPRGETCGGFGENIGEKEIMQVQFRDAVTRAGMDELEGKALVIGVDTELRVFGE